MKLFSLLHAFFNPAAITRTYLTLWGGGDGDGGGGSSTSTSYSTNLPEYAQPYYQELLKQTGREVFATDASGNVTGMKPATSLPQQTVAGFNPLQQQTQQAVAGMQTPGQFGQSTQGLTAGQGLGYGMAQQGIERALAYQPENIGAMGVYNPELEQFQMQGPQNVNAPNLSQFGMSAAQTAYRPQLQNYQMQGPQNVTPGQGITANQIQAATTNYRPDLRQYAMGPAERVSTDTATGNQLQQYMSPYQDAVTDVAVREAKLQGDLAKQQGALGSIGRGTFGGARQALMQSEQQRGLNQQLADIRYKGAQDAYSQAQAQFNADQARKMQAATANQQAGLTTGQANLQSQLQTQQLGTQSGLQAVLANLNNQQQANVQSEANRLQAQGMTADNALKAALANQQAGLTTGQQNLAANLQTQQLGAETGTQMALANLTNAQQANVQNLAAQLQTQGLSAENAMRAALANQQAGITTGQSNLQALLGVQQLGAGQSLEAQKANQAAALQAAQLNQQGRQFGATLGSQVGLAGLQSVVDSSKALGALGSEQQQADLARLTAQGAAGTEQQALAQRQADIEYQNEMARQNYARQQLQYYSDILRGNAGALGSTQVQYTPTPSTLSQVGGLGLAGLGLAKAIG